jgi:hypothetical protein
MEKETKNKPQSATLKAKQLNRRSPNLDTTRTFQSQSVHHQSINQETPTFKTLYDYPSSVTETLGGPDL